MSIILASLLAASAPSFDCSRATLPVERMICGDAELSEADRLLAAAYSRVPARRGLAAEQRAWLTERNACETRDCVLGRYETRNMTLVGRARLPLVYDRASGSDVPARLSMAALGNGEYLFRLLALRFTRDRSNFSDSIADGLLRTANGRGVWRDAEGCRLAFTRRGKGWQIEQSGTCRNGIGTTMSGDYRG